VKIKKKNRVMDDVESSSDIVILSPFYYQCEILGILDDLTLVPAFVPVTIIRT